MKNIQEGRKGVPSNLPNLCFVHKGLIEQICSILLFGFLSVRLPTFSVLLLLCHRARNVEAHFDELINSTARLLPSGLDSIRVPIGAIGSGLVGSRGKGKLHGNLVLASQIRVHDFGVWDFEGGATLDVEGKLCSTKLNLSPIPSPQGVLLVFEPNIVPVLENFADALEVLAVLGR